MYKLVAIDIDGTLLKNDKTLSKRNRECINKAVKMGIKVVITTGRPVLGIMTYLKDLDLIGEEEYAIADNGATVYNTKDFSLIHEKALTGKDIKYIYPFMKKENTEIELHVPEGGLVEKDAGTVFVKKRMPYMELKTVDIMKDVKDDDKVFKLLVFSEADVIEDMYSNIPQEILEKYTAVRALNNMFEFMHKGSTKASGIEVLGKHLGISREEIISIGDELNDLDMIEYAGLGVAMGNAREEVKNKADFITKSNEEDGVAYAIEKFIFKDRERNGEVD